MVTEARAARLDLYARTKFTKEGREITESRAVIEELFGDNEVQVARSAQGLANVASMGWLEVG